MSDKELSSKEKLARALEKRHNPNLANMIRKARQGYYSDYESPLVNPIIQLVHDLNLYREHGLVKRAVNGEFDGTEAEAEAWINSKEGRETLKDPILVEEAREMFIKITGVDPYEDQIKDNPN